MSDLRNSLSLKIYRDVKKKFPYVNGYDPTLTNIVAKKNKIINKLNNINRFDVYIISIKHDEIKN